MHLHKDNIHLILWLQENIHSVSRTNESDHLNNGYLQVICGNYVPFVVCFAIPVIG
jgi:hypothetical protein